MTKKTSPLWDYYMEEIADSTSVLCQVVNCRQKKSRGKTGTERSRLSNTGMRTHLMTAHGKEWQEFLTKEIKVQEAKLDDREEVLEAHESENGGVSLFNMNTHKKRNSFFYSKICLIWFSQR